MIIVSIKQNIWAYISFFEANLIYFIDLLSLSLIKNKMSILIIFITHNILNNFYEY